MWMTEWDQEFKSVCWITNTEPNKSQFRSNGNTDARISN